MKNILTYLAVAVLSLTSVASVFANEKPIDKPVENLPVKALECSCCKGGCN